MMAFCVFLIVGTLWLYIRPDFGVVAALRRRLALLGSACSAWRAR
jgi:hypothetical protein